MKEPLWRFVQWPASRLNEHLATISTSSGAHSDTAYVETASGSCFIICRKGTRSEFKSFLMKAKRQKLPMSAVFEGLEAWRDRF